MSNNFVKRRWLVGFGVALCLLFLSDSFALAIPQPPTATVAEEPSTAFEYTRELSGVNGEIEALQVAIRRFEPVRGHGPTVSLVSAVHLGEKDYYKQLQRFLNKQDVVLFEGVKPPRKMKESVTASTLSITLSVVLSLATRMAISVVPSASTTALPEQFANVAEVILPTKKVEAGKVSISMGFQIAMAEALNLQYQPDGIDYLRPNFQNSDLSWDQMEELVAKDGAGATEKLKDVAARLTGSVTSDTAAMFNEILEAAKANPMMFRRKIVESIYSPDILSPTDPQEQDQKNLEKILIAERNKAVLADLKAITDKTGKPVHTIAIFYGAGHMQDMEQHLVGDMGYRPVGTKWLTAITVTFP